jgi:hypothetical protein
MVGVFQPARLRTAETRAQGYVPARSQGGSCPELWQLSNKAKARPPKRGYPDMTGWIKCRFDYSPFLETE